MSVAGLDVGNCTSCVALARKRGVDVIMNSESKRETPAMVSYGDKMRFIGVEGAARMMMNVKNTVIQVKRLIGRKFKDPAVQKDIKDMMFKVSEAADGGCLISVMYLNEARTLSPEQVVTSLLKDLKSTAEADQGSAITDCVISVPAYFSESERRAMLTAADVAGLKCLRLMNELTAAALNWGIFKPDLPEDQPLNVAFVDIGHSSLQVCIVAFKKAQMEVKAHSWDRCLGGRDLDAVLVAHFAAEFKSKTGLDITQNAKACYRMKAQVEKSRLILTSGPLATISVECLMEDTDFRSEITLEKFEELAAPVLERVVKPCEDALKTAGLTIEQISSVEMVGAASRTPAIVRKVAEFFKQEPKRTMHSKECVSRGCSLQAAMLSPIFQVRHFDVKDLYPFKVNISWEKDGAPTTSQLFGEIVKDGSTVPQFVPCVKNVAFMKTEPFSIQATYSDDSNLGGGSKDIASFNITEPHKAPDTASSLSCKVSFELDLHGLVRCVQAVHCHKVEVEEPAPAEAAADGAPAAPPSDSATGSAADASETGTAMETDGPAVDTNSKVKKTKKVSKDVTVVQTFHTDLGMETKQRLLEEEGQMGAADSLQRATDEAKNALEEYVYMLRSKVSGDCSEFVNPADRDALVSELNAMEDWLYEDGEDEKKSVYEAKHSYLKEKGAPILLRYSEASTRDQAMQSLSNACQHGLEWVKTNDPKYAHIEAGDREAVRAECAAALSWLEGKSAAQAALSKVDQPAVLTHELIQRKQTLENIVHPIMNKPAPPPPKPEAEVKVADTDKAGGPAPMDEDMPGDGTPAQNANGNSAAEAQPMEEP